MPNTPATTDASLEGSAAGGHSTARLELLPLPQVAIEAANLAADGDGGAAALARPDPARRRAREPGDPRRELGAVCAPRADRLAAPGHRWLRRRRDPYIALAFAVRPACSAQRAFEPQLQALWRESVATARLRAEIARPRRRKRQRPPTSAGLLHRVGLAVILWRLGRARDAGVVVEEDSMTSFVGGFEIQVGAQLARLEPAEPVAAAVQWFRRPGDATHSRLEVMEGAGTRLAELLEEPEDVAANARLDPRCSTSSASIRTTCSGCCNVATRSPRRSTASPDAMVPPASIRERHTGRRTGRLLVLGSGPAGEGRDPGGQGRPVRGPGRARARGQRRLRPTGTIPSKTLSAARPRRRQRT